MLLARSSALILRFISFALIANVLLASALAANPGWHEWAHHHDCGEEHEVCIVELLLQGGVDAQTPAPVCGDAPRLESGEVLPPAVVTAAGSFLGGSILEHGPPRRQP